MPGDLVTQYRHFEREGFVEGPRPSHHQATWRVLRVEAVEVVLELVEGAYSLYEDEADVRPGHVMRLRNSVVYRRHFGRTHPNQQAWDEFRVVALTRPSR